MGCSRPPLLFKSCHSEEQSDASIQKLRIPRFVRDDKPEANRQLPVPGREKLDDGTIEFVGHLFVRQVADAVERQQPAMAKFVLQA